MRKDVKLSNGMVVSVAPVPPAAYDDVDIAFPYPPKPIRETETASGETMRWYDEKDPEYLAAKEAVERKRDEAREVQRLLWALPDVYPPGDDDWLADIICNKRALFPNWQPPEDLPSRKVLYIKFVLMAVLNDALAVTEAINELTGISTERAKQIEATFPGGVEQDADRRGSGKKERAAKKKAADIKR